ncbi:MAG: hypothetical protein V5A88_08835 [Candidatus Thermoplasmatota archaeon]
MKKKSSPQNESEKPLALMGAVSPEEISSESTFVDETEKSVDDIDIGETEDMLVDAIDEVTSAFAEIKYAKQRDLLSRNIDEIEEMIESAEFQLNVILRELEEVK